ncbi:hypothetical protein AAFF_G00251170 [Aldrovandia affinis]|uniref:Microtubule-associated protein 1A/B/S-like MBL-like domain-containing protein n=1 Tax=Aldrovandia affinis TaxID=143900 RepID=A0AAD7W399_9TELE|nr:hypothetical protein AAFF_G00251170 [Aldrovandia affinis]
MEAPQDSAPSPFELLEPPGSAGFLRLSRPCCYVFPAGAGGGGSAFFAVDGFSMLVDGGADARPCFWRLLRRLDRVDALMLTHAGPGSLTGVASLLRRKVAELEEKEERAGAGGGAQTSGSSLPRSAWSPDEGDLTALILRCLERLAIAPEPLSRTPGPHAQPITLFRKMGVGQLELYVLSPGRGGPASVCALLVWRPARLWDRPVRVLFPGRAPQGTVLEGLERLKHLDFLRRAPARPEQPAPNPHGPGARQGGRRERATGGRGGAGLGAGPGAGGAGPGAETPSPKRTGPRTGWRWRNLLKPRNQRKI